MPWKSKAQARWGHSAAGKEALGGEAGVHEWDTATHGKKLPEKVAKFEHLPRYAKSEKLTKFGGMGQLSLSECQPKHPTLQKFRNFLNATRKKRTNQAV